LGTVADFKNPKKMLNRPDLEKWLRENEASLKADVAAWLPSQLSGADRQQLLEGLIDDTLGPIDNAIEYDGVAAGASAASAAAGAGATSTTTGAAASAATNLEAPEEEGEERPGRDPASENLLDRLLYKGVLPRYAFPTDVAAFHVFDVDRSTLFRPA